MTDKHTPGPWHCKQSASRTHPFSIMGGGFNLAQVENIDDACLIALAPDMLAALQNAAGLLDTPLGRRLFDGSDFYQEVVKSVRTAITKATTETDRT